MNSAAAFFATLQVIAAFLIFVAVYLAIVVCTIICLVVAELISEHSSVVREYGEKLVSLNRRVSSKIKGEPHGSFRKSFVSRLAEGSKDAARPLPLVLARNQRP